MKHTGARGTSTPPSPSIAVSITIACWRIACTSSMGGGLPSTCAPPADGADALCQHADEAAVRVDDRQPRRRGSGGRRRLVGGLGTKAFDRLPLAASVEAARAADQRPFHRIFTSRTRGFNQPLPPSRHAGPRNARVKLQKEGARALTPAVSSSTRRARRWPLFASRLRRRQQRRAEPLRLDQGRRVQHRRTAHGGSGRALPGGEPRREDHGRDLRHRAAASRSSAPARPTSPTPRGRSSPRKSRPARRRASRTATPRSRTTGSPWW